jgi:hypothetical protein
VLIVATVIPLLSVAACTSTADYPAKTPALSASSGPSEESSVGVPVVNGYPFGPASFWRSTVTDAPVAEASASMIQYLTASISDRYGGIAAFNAHQYNSPLYTATAKTKVVDFGFSDCQRKGYTPAGLLGEGGQFVGVPVPDGAVPANGTDGELSIYSPITDQLWEFWKASRASDGGWQACWGGRLDHVSTSTGYFPGAFGATASGLPNAGGLIRLAEIKRGEIGHVMSLVIPNPAEANNFSWPAQRSDGVDANPAALPEGIRLRLNPDLDLADLGLSKAGLIVAKAAQRFGFVVVDRGGAVSVLAEAVPGSTGGDDPWGAELAGPDYEVLKNFPWSSMQVVQKDFGKPSS